jgi:hypothetical protein
LKIVMLLNSGCVVPSARLTSQHFLVVDQPGSTDRIVIETVS